MPLLPNLRMLVFTGEPEQTPTVERGAIEADVPTPDGATPRQLGREGERLPESFG